MSRKQPIAVGEYYHLYNRGVEKRDIFIDDHDRERFLRLLYIANGDQPFVLREIGNKKLSQIKRGESLAAIGAYCLMQNHFHILVKEIVGGGIVAFARKLGTSYAKSFNERYQRVGPLFQGRFKVEHVTDDRHMAYLYEYIHLNPLRAKDEHWKTSKAMGKNSTLEFLSGYRYSSFLDYFSPKKPREERMILSREEFPEYFTDTSFSKFIDGWLAFQGEV